MANEIFDRVGYHLRPAGLHHFLKELKSSSADGNILSDGVVGKLIIMGNMACVGVSVLVSHPCTIVTTKRNKVKS